MGAVAVRSDLERMWDILSNPLNLLLLAVLVYFISVLVYPPLPPPRTGKPPSNHTDDYNWLPDKYPDCLVIQSYTEDDIAKYDGRQKGGRILLAIQDVERPKEKGGQWTHKKRTVFDVTRGGQFYGPDGPYGNFAGRDASRGMAKQSFDEDMLNPLDAPLDALDDLTSSEYDNMAGWHSHFTNKYTVVGDLVERSSP